MSPIIRALVKPACLGFVLSLPVYATFIVPTILHLWISFALRLVQVAPSNSWPRSMLTEERLIDILERGLAMTTPSKI